MNSTVCIGTVRHMDIRVEVYGLSRAEWIIHMRRVAFNPLKAWHGKRIHYASEAQNCAHVYRNGPTALQAEEILHEAKSGKPAFADTLTQNRSGQQRAALRIA